MLCSMESESIFKKNFLALPHFPTYLLVIGYLAYWIELYCIRLGRGHTSPLAFIASALYFLICLIFYVKKYNWQDLGFWLCAVAKRIGSGGKMYILSSCLLLFIIVCSGYALLLPPHLPQEFDSLNYHITLPKQHLIVNSFRHIRWAAADLFLLPLQFSLAPYWLMTELPNKLPQILFVLGVLAISWRLVKKLGALHPEASSIAIFAIVGSHAIGIQMGTAMLDLVISYLCLAAIDSFLERRYILSSIEAAFFVWSKPFVPFQMMVLVTIILLLVFGIKKFKLARICLGFNGAYIRNFCPSGAALKKTLFYFIVAGIVIAGPFIAKSTYYAGTPLYPFFPGLINVSSIDKTSLLWQSLEVASQKHLTTKDAYGSGKSLADFALHLWMVAVPEQGVNNRYDYPLGLPYLLFVVPFIYFTFISLKRRKLPLLSIFIILYWILWWLGSQQSRFLFVPLILMIITVAAAIEQPSKVFVFCLTLSLLLCAISFSRAYYRDFGISRYGILREQDKQIIKMNKAYREDKRNDVVVLERYDVAYANFPVKVVLPRSNASRWVLKY